MKILIFVYTCTAYEKTRALLQENSWAKDNLDVVFVTDNPNSILKNNIYLGEYTKAWYLKDPFICKKIFKTECDFRELGFIQHSRSEVCARHQRCCISTRLS